MYSIVGYTGFVGSNIYVSDVFEGTYNSKNIKQAYGTRPELLIYAGVPAEKYLANVSPDKDMQQIKDAQKNIVMIDPQKLVLISTIDVINNPVDVDERVLVESEALHPYGYNRFLLEEFVREHYPNALIVRLPGLYGKNIKKNFIYDIINLIPNMLRKEKMSELEKTCPALSLYYEYKGDGFFKVKNLDKEEKNNLKKIFEQLDFSAINFTDSRNVYQFYNLNRLWKDISKALDADIKLLHLATEPVSAKELYQYLTGEIFENEVTYKPVKYNYKTIYDKLFGGDGGYICKKQEVLSDIRDFVFEERNKKDL